MPLVPTDPSSLPRPGRLNLITDVPGLTVGNAEDADVATGVTVILAEGDGTGGGGAIAAVDTRGGAPGTRETDALRPGTLVDRANAIVLSGGSAFGLDAASGVHAWLAAAGRGFAIAGKVVPIVPAAILFDLANGGNKDWGDDAPYRRLGRAACDAAATRFDLGNAGAGYGAIAGPVKGGLGSCSAVDPDSGYTVGALIAVNAVGSPITPDGSGLWAWPFELAGEFGVAPPAMNPTGGTYATKRSRRAGENTTIGVVATDAPLTVAQAERIAIMAHDGLARAIHPIHSPFDGDLLFSLAATDGKTGTVTPDLLMHLGVLAADAVARAVGRAIVSARPLHGTPSFVGR